jgi:hypothetical protein
MTFEENIQEWISDWVSQHNPTLGAVPCPFAKQAMLNDTIVYREFSNSDLTSLRHQLYELANGDWDDTKEVLVLYASTGTLSVDELQVDVLRFNNTCKQSNKDLVALEDHPNDPEVINGVTMNFGKGILVLIQRLSKLNKASAILSKQGYYNNWTQENLDDVVNWRKSS